MMTTLSHRADISPAPATTSCLAERLYPITEDSSEITVVCRRDDYSAAIIARAVEDSDCHLLNLNVTADRPAGTSDSSIVVELRINRRDPSAAARSLERYGYEVTDTRSASGETIPDALALDRLRNLIRRLEE